MEGYALAENEVVLFKSGRVTTSVLPDQTVELILTNLYLVYTYKVKVGFMKFETKAETYPMDTVKIYNDKPQVKQKGAQVELYLLNSVHEISFDSIFTAKKFVSEVYTLVSGKNAAERSAEKVKSGINLVDETLGFDTVGTVKDVLQNGVVGTLLGGIGRKKKSSSKKMQLAETITGAIANNKTTPAIPEKTDDAAKPSMSLDEQMEAVTKLKALLDQGFITQEEYDLKKKEIFNL